MKSQTQDKIQKVIPDIDHPEANFLRNSVGRRTPINVKLYKEKAVILDVDVFLPMGYSSSLYAVALYCVLNEHMRQGNVIKWNSASFINSEGTRQYQDVLLKEIKQSLICASARMASYEDDIDKSIERAQAFIKEDRDILESVKTSVYCQMLYGGIVAHHTEFEWHVGAPKSSIKTRFKKMLKL